MQVSTPISIKAPRQSHAARGLARLGEGVGRGAARNSQLTVATTYPQLAYMRSGAHPRPKISRKPGDVHPICNPQVVKVA